MIESKLVRLLLLPFGLLARLGQLANDGSRDIQNRLRFRGSIIDRNCSINPGTTIHENCRVLENSLILNSTINRFSYVGRNSMVQNAEIGPFCSIANDAIIGLGTHPLELFSTSPLFYRVSNILGVDLVDRDHEFEEYRKINIGHDVWIGARAIVLDGVSVGNGAVIASNAVVTRNVPPYAIVAGVPARVVRDRFPPEKIAYLENSEWWTWQPEQIRDRMADLNAMRELSCSD